MRILTTALLGALALALAVVIYFIDRKPVEGRDAAARANVLVRFEAESIDQMVIENSGGKTVMKKRGAYWFFDSPETDRAHSGKVSVLLDQLNHLSILDRVTRKEISSNPELSSKKLGFSDETAIHVHLSETKKKGGGQPHQYRVTLGLASERANTLYARSSDEDDGAFVVDGNPRKFLESPLEAMRDRQLLGVPVEGIVQMVISSSKGEIALQRKITQPTSNWALLRPLKTWANEDKMDQLLADLSGLQIEEVVPNSSGAFQIPHPLPDHAVMIRIAVFGMEKAVTIFLEEKKTAGDGKADQAAPPVLEARVSDRPYTYLVRSPFLKNLPTAPNDLRDRHLARIPIQNLQSITIQSRIDPVVFLKAERLPEGLIRWDVNVGEHLVPANLGAVKSLVNGVNEAAIVRFVSDTAEGITEYGLDPPARRVAFQVLYPGKPDAAGKTGPPRVVIRTLKLGWKEGDEEHLFANFEGEPYVYELDPTFVGLIPTHPIKWRSLNVMSFNAFHLKKIVKEMSGQSPVVMDYDYRRDAWKATRGGRDITSSMDIGGLRKLRDRLGAFTAAGWYLSLAKAYAALETPSVKFTIVTSELDPATNESHDVTRVLKLAPAAGNLYFGQIEESPDVFFVDKKMYENLIAPVTSSRIQAP